MTSRGELLFVYGTLRRGHPARELLRGCREEGAGPTAPGYAVVDLDDGRRARAYLLAGPPPRGAARVQSGDWVRHRAEATP